MIVRSVVLRCRPERAFALFTEHAGLWWPVDRRHTDDASSVIRLEASGRFYERSSDGTEVELGVVRVFEPVSRLSLDWYPGTGREHPTQVDVLFETVGTSTRVTITHGPGSAGSELFNINASRYADSWNHVLMAITKHTGENA